MRYLVHAFVCASLVLVGSCGGTETPTPAAGPGPGGGDLAIQVGAVPRGTVGTPYALALQVTGGTGAGHAWRIVSGAPPSGLGFYAPGACPTWTAFGETGQLDTSLGAGVLTETSGIAVSRRNPGVYWVHDDGDRPSDLYALASDGSLRQRYHLDIPNVDWEDLALGPGPDPALEYLYVGDVGDNGSSRTDVRVLRVAEPIVPATPGVVIDLPFEAFYFAYPDGPQDCETLLVDWATGTPYLVEKDTAGGNVYKFPMPLDPAWNAANPTTLIAVTSGRPLPASLTGGDATRDGRRVVLRGYFPPLLEYVRPAGGTFDALFTQTPCSISFLRIQQYEAIAYGPQGLDLVTTTEETSYFSSSPLMTSSATVPSLTVSIEGVPTATGTYPFVVEVRNAAGETAQQALEIIVD